MMRGFKACISAAHPLAVETGIEVLRQGGNAVDAAIAVSYMLGVVEPHASGIGGGGVMLVQPADGDAEVLDYRETAPLSGRMSAAEAGVPGLVRGMEQARARYGTMSMERLIEPAIRAAQQGVPASAALARQIGKSAQLQADRHAPLFPGGEPLRAGERLVQPELAETMRGIQRHGADWFYRGEPARRLMARVDGLEQRDFDAYRVEIRKPVRARLGEWEIVTVPPPFGGVTLAQALKLAFMTELHKQAPGSAAYCHLWGEIMRLCYETRQTSLADPAFHDVSAEELLGDDYLRAMQRRIRPDLAVRAEFPGEVSHTTHFNIIDAQGMCVSVTNTIGGFFGNGIWESGFFLNNQLRNFSDAPASPNRFQPGKRPMSFAAPSIIRNARAALVIGAAGGKRIPTQLAMIVMKVVQYGFGLEEAIASPRVFIDDGVLYAETPQDADAAAQLERLGYRVEHNPDPMFYGGVQGLYLDFADKEVQGASDPRRGGSWAVWDPEGDSEHA